MSSEFARSIGSTGQHIRLLNKRIGAMRNHVREAEEQLLHRIGAEWRAGGVSPAYLVALYDWTRGLGIPAGWWDTVAGIPYREIQRIRIRLGQRPNGPEGRWEGAWPVPVGAPAPPKGQAVVYVLFDERNQPVYTGSTEQFRDRLRTHAKTKQFTSWHAYPRPDREDAYRVEDAALKRHKPPLNVRAGR